MNQESIYIVASYTDTVPGKLITARAKLKFWNRYDGDTYSHISLSRDSKLNNMISFARKEIGNPFNSGMIKEDIRKDMFTRVPEKSKIAVMQLGVSLEQVAAFTTNLNRDWERRDNFQFNYIGLVALLCTGTFGLSRENHYFCSQWATSILRESGIEIFEGKRPQDIRPFDFYRVLKEYIIYEGLTRDYPEEGINNPPKVYQYKGYERGK